MVAPVAGLRPSRAARCVRSTLGHPGMLTLVPSPTDFARTAKSESTTPETAAWLWPESAATAATRSFLFSVLSAMSVLLGLCALHVAYVAPERLAREPPLKLAANTGISGQVVPVRPIPGKTRRIRCGCGKEAPDRSDASHHTC